MHRLPLRGVGGTHLVLLILALLAAACGTAPSDDSSADVLTDEPDAIAFEATTSTSTSVPELKTIRVAARNSIGASPLWIADARGFFRDQGIAIEYVPVTDEGAVSSALAAQEAAIAIVSSTAAARSNTTRQLVEPIVYVDATDGGSDAERGSLSLVAPVASEIDNGCDLEGKTVAVDSIRSISAVALREVVLREGCNPLAVRFTTLDGREIASQLMTGEVDAAATFDPITTELLRGPNVLVENLDFALCGGTERCPIWIAVARSDWAASNPELNAGFIVAMEGAINWIFDNQLEYRAELVSCCAVNADDAAAVVVPNFPGDRRDFQRDLTRLRTVIQIQNENLDLLRSGQTVAAASSDEDVVDDEAVDEEAAPEDEVADS